MTVLGDSPKIFFEERQYYLNTMVHEYDNRSVPFGIYISKYNGITICPSFRKWEEHPDGEFE